MTCPTCHDTGATGNAFIYDCAAPGCTAAIDRSRLEVALKKEGYRPASGDEYDAAWWGYQRGKAAALEQAARYKLALQRITLLKNQDWGDDWQEIEEARQIANHVLKP